MACYSILAVLVFVVKLLLYFSLIYLTDISKEYSHYPIHAGVPQGAIWSPILFNLYVRQLPLQVHYCHIVSYADDSTLLKVVPSKEARDLTARETKFDLNALVCWGKKWHIEFEPAKSSAISISLKRDLQDHLSLVMDGIPIVEVETLSVLGFCFDCRLTWVVMIDEMASHSRQRFGCLRRILDYLDSI